jgi:hypothetical protein
MNMVPVGGLERSFYLHGEHEDLYEDLRFEEVEDGFKLYARS